MDNIQIEKALRSDPLVNEIFVGVFAANTLPKQKEFPAGYISNTEASNQSGQHWVAFFHTGNSRAGVAAGHAPFSLVDKGGAYLLTYEINPKTPDRCSQVNCRQNEITAAAKTATARKNLIVHATRTRKRPTKNYSKCFSARIQYQRICSITTTYEDTRVEHVCMYPSNIRDTVEVIAYCQHIWTVKDRSYNVHRYDMDKYKCVNHC